MRKHPLLGAAFRFFIGGAILFPPWPVVGEVYSAVFGETSRLWLTACRGTGFFGDIGPLFLNPAPSHPGLCDTEIGFEKPELGVWWLHLNSRRRSYLPLAILWCLAIATPFPWRSRIRAIVLGSLLLSVFLTVQLTVTVAHLASLDLSDLEKQSIVGYVLDAVNNAQWLWVLLPVVTWFFLVFRRVPWVEFLTGPSGNRK